MQPSKIIPCKNLLGESPIWNYARSSFMWVDIDGQLLYEYHLKSEILKSWSIDQKVSLVLESGDTEVVLALQDGLAKFDLTIGLMTWLLDVEKDNTQNRPNDGAVDARGRLWLGTMALDCKAGEGKLYCIESDLSITVKIEKTTISNGIIWNADNTKMYFIDSATYVVKSYHFELETGNIAFEKDIIKIDPNVGMPDGMALDEEGMLWIAVWGGKGIYRYNPTNGELLETAEVDAPNVTSCTFGGEKINQLFITTASIGLTAQEALDFPDSGNVFVFQTEVAGVSNKNRFYPKN